MKRIKYRKTYGARGLLEWQMSVRAGDATLRILFKGGTMGSNGVIPAKFTTDNAAIQRLIESSPQFRTGKVYLHGSPVEAGFEEIPAPMVQSAPKPEEDTSRHISTCHDTDNERDNITGGSSFRGESSDYE